MIEDIRALIISVAEDVREEQGLDDASVLGPDSQLFGQEGLFDSMGLVSLIVALEQAIEEKFEVRVALADEKALSQKSSPYRTVESLTAYAAAQFGQ